MDTLTKILCFFKQHKWVSCQRQRYCEWCDKRQELEFYSNRTQEWVDV